ncbi:hypothetical protein QQM39_07685 [Streptomyces sp. DT2A-34]|uniref:hypothetical protein n=1 Tax=Streptomyces sp. DT2A-34 TaxID=3051182 RepID=UPI00265C7B66|nr:hypothetical protein [Streptomyces sp. DT2A-34]MDO0910734.1 hypothetical protein [Streptomyces sp. DT2A-34]
MRTRHLIGTTLATAALFVGVAAAPAQAAENPLSTTGAQGMVSFYSMYVRACDTLKDGRRAVAQAVNQTTGEYLGGAEDTGGADGACAFDYFTEKPSRGDVIYLAVWRQDGAGGWQEDFRYTTWTY